MENNSFGKLFNFKNENKKNDIKDLKNSIIFEGKFENILLKNDISNLENTINGIHTLLNGGEVSIINMKGGKEKNDSKDEVVESSGLVGESINDKVNRIYKLLQEVEKKYKTDSTNLETESKTKIDEQMITISENNKEISILKEELKSMENKNLKISNELLETKKDLDISKSNDQIDLLSKQEEVISKLNEEMKNVNNTNEIMAEELKVTKENLESIKSKNIKLIENKKELNEAIDKLTLKYTKLDKLITEMKNDQISIDNLNEELLEEVKPLDDSNQPVVIEEIPLKGGNNLVDEVLVTEKQSEVINELSESNAISNLINLL